MFYIFITWLILILMLILLAQGIQKNSKDREGYVTRWRTIGVCIIYGVTRGIYRSQHRAGTGFVFYLGILCSLVMRDISDLGKVWVQAVQKEVILLPSCL